MTKKIIGTSCCCFLLAFLSLEINAQEAPVFQEKPRKVKMPKYYVADLPKKSIPVKGIYVQQAVWDSTRLGYVQKGMINIKAEAIPADDLTELLQNYLTKQYEDQFKKEGSELLVMIKELRINERTFFSSEVAFAKIEADAWITSDGEKFRKISAIDTVLVYISMADVTSEHGNNIARGLDHLIQSALENAKAGKHGSDEMNAKEIAQKAKERYEVPILMTTHYKQGAYMSFQEFVNNEPSMASFEINVLDKKKGKVEIVDAADRIKPLTPWGICKDGEIYKYHEQELIALEKKNNGFIFSDYQEKASRRNSGIFMGGLLGGLAGAAIASGSNKMYSVTTIPYITKKQPEACSIDMRTGNISF